MKRTGILVTFAAVLSASAGAANYFVAPCGQDFWLGLVPNCVGPTGPKRTIQAAINAATDGDTIFVLPGTYIGTIDLDGKAVSIVGTGGYAVTILDGNGAGPVILCDSGEGPDTIIQGLTIRNGLNTTTGGGGMRIVFSSPTILDCHFTDNRSNVEGGAIASVLSTPTISGTIFTLNRAGAPGSITGRGGAISASGGTVTIDDCSFDTNRANAEGGAIMVAANTSLVVGDSDFSANRALGALSTAGGDISSNSATIELTNTTLADAFATRGGSLFAMNGSEVTLTGVSIANADATGDSGGAINAFLSSIDIVGGNFTGNSAMSSGGAITAVVCEVSITLSGFNQNTAQDGGGGALWSAQSTVTAGLSTFTDNAAVSRGGAIGGFFTDLTVEGCTFAQNTAELSGGGIGLAESALEVIATTFDSNTSVTNGGGVYFQFDPLAMNEPTEPRGGGMPPPGAGVATIEGSTFVNNVGRSGAGLSVESGTAFVVDGVFDANTATLFGGGVYVDFDALLDMRDSSLTDNTASDGGGALLYGSAVIVGCAFSGNSAPRGGGLSTVTGFGLVSGSGDNFRTILSSVFSGNTATNRGSAMDLRGITTITNSIVHDNVSPFGTGAIRADGLGDFILSNSVVYGNSGGGISVTSVNTDAFVRNSIVRANANGGQFPEFDPVVQYSNVQGGVDGPGNIDADPLFLSPVTGNFRLSATSPCIDAGNTWAVPADSIDLDGDGDQTELTPLDLDGNSRFANAPGVGDTGCGGVALVDMGPFEVVGVGAPGPVVPGDVNGDGIVNFSDLNALLSVWGVCAVDCCPADFNLDGLVDFNDLNTLLSNYN